MGAPFIVTYTGKQFFFDDVQPDSIDIRDIAHALSQLCRFTGHSNLFYSVAQHSLLVSEKMPGRPIDKLTALLHDAAEAYIGDVSSPLKSQMRYCGSDYESEGPSHYDDLEREVNTVIQKKFSLPPAIPLSSAGDLNLWKIYDGAAVVFEGEGFMGLSLEELTTYSFPVHLHGLWQPWEPLKFAAENSDLEMSEVETRFLERFEDLMDQLGRKDVL